MARMPVQHRARLREDGGIERGPRTCGAAQVDAMQCIRMRQAGLRREPADAVAQAKENGRRQPAGDIAFELIATRCVQALRGIGQRAPIFIQQYDTRLRPERGQRVRVVTQVIGAIQRTFDEGEWRARD